MFFKNKKSDEIIEEKAVEETEQVPVSTDNIFKELSWWIDFWDDKKDEKKEIKKDVIYYLELSKKIFIWVNIWFFVLLFFFFSYLKIQNNVNLYSKSILDPICFLVLSDDMKNTWDYCSSVKSLESDYKTKIESLKKDIITKLSSLAEDIYSIENFAYSREVSFLLDTESNKLNIVNLMNDFDRMKNDFSTWDKKMLVCDKIKITKDEADFECDAYSSSWETTAIKWWWIVWETWDRNTSLIQWTSISIASSFLNFIEKNPWYNFRVLEKQKIFSSEVVVWEWPYVRKTTFNFKLKYSKPIDDLSL